MPLRGGRARARFDERAFAGDADRLSRRDRQIVALARKDFEREGVELDRLRACQDEHMSGTRLPGCVKVYLPDAAGQWRMIFQISIAGEAFVLSYLAAGVGHQPRGSRAPDAYQLAHHRMHGRWPRRDSA